MAKDFLFLFDSIKNRTTKLTKRLPSNYKGDFGVNSQYFVFENGKYMHIRRISSPTITIAKFLSRQSTAIPAFSNQRQQLEAILVYDPELAWLKIANNRYQLLSYLQRTYENRFSDELGYDGESLWQQHRGGLWTFYDLQNKKATTYKPKLDLEPMSTSSRSKHALLKNESDDHFLLDLKSNKITPVPIKGSYETYLGGDDFFVLDNWLILSDYSFGRKKQYYLAYNLSTSELIKDDFPAEDSVKSFAYFENKLILVTPEEVYFVYLKSGGIEKARFRTNNMKYRSKTAPYSAFSSNIANGFSVLSHRTGNTKKITLNKKISDLEFFGDGTWLAASSANEIDYFKCKN